MITTWLPPLARRIASRGLRSRSSVEETQAAGLDVMCKPNDARVLTKPLMPAALRCSAIGTRFAPTWIDELGRTAAGARCRRGVALCCLHAASHAQALRRRCDHR